ncbi:MAG TPA: hypothetical protein VG759_12800 [Candidatus Angelobacter sp.]|nr:hypothetical protein [Candidatus Angelobacter sp.]
MRNEYNFSKGIRGKYAGNVAHRILDTSPDPARGRPSVCIVPGNHDLAETVTGAARKIAEQLTKRYPVLYHMGWYGSWPSIRKFGLLSTSELLNLFQIRDPQRTDLLTKQRRTSVPIFHKVYGSAVLRDQKPLSERNLARCLTDCDATTWYTILNERVFFWLNRDRLLKLMSAAEYVGKPHTIIEIETAAFISQYVPKIELSHINTGNTRPYPHPRGRSTFRKIVDYPYTERRHLSDYSAVVELTVLGGVPDIRKYVRSVEHGMVVKGKYQVIDQLFKPDMSAD